MSKKKGKKEGESEGSGLKVRRKGKKYKGADERPVLVELPQGPRVVVMASSHDDAWEKFKKVCGIFATDHKPRFSRPGPEIETDANGVVLGHHIEGALKPDDGNEWDLEEEDDEDENEEE